MGGDGNPAMNASDDRMGALRREWLAARIVVPVALVAVLAALAYPLFFNAPPAPAAPDDVSAAQPAPVDNGQAADAPDPAAGAMICRTAVAGAQNFGVLPGTAKPSGDGQPKPESLRGRYDCPAEADGAGYRIAVDLICKQFDSQDCVALYSVTNSQGATLYRRQQ